MRPSIFKEYNFPELKIFGMTEKNENLIWIP